jgi:uncharacterized protein (TIGR02145 family)
MKMKKILNLGVVLSLCYFCGCSSQNDPTKDENKNANATTITDASGNVYHTIQIGTQTWMVENLKTTKYNDGSSIPNVTNATEWSNLTGAAYCNYNNDINNVDKYGRLYNWYAVNTGNLAPIGWHVPYKSDWETLNQYLTDRGYGYGGSGDDVAKSIASNENWTSSTTKGDVGNDIISNNITGFNAVPAGSRGSNGVYGSLNGIAIWWSASRYYGNYSNGQPYSWKIFYNANNIQNGYSTSWNGGMSIRCVKD